MSKVASLFFRKVRTLAAMSWGQRCRRLVALLVRTGKLPFYPLYFPAGWLLARFGMRFFSNRYLLPHIGHLAPEPDFFIRACRADLQPHKIGIILVPPRGRIANRALLGYWSRHPQIKVVTNWPVVILLWPFTWMRSVSYYSLNLVDDKGRRLSGWPANDYMLRVDHRLTGGSAILQITDEDERYGRVILDLLGVPRDAWWACLHVRDSRSFAGGGDDSELRDADLATYLDAVRAVVARGGWVIRIGHPGQSLPDIPQVVDYANRPTRLDWMDLYLIDRARFFLGSDSGPTEVAYIFGTPVAAANYAPMGHGLLMATDIFIPKLYCSTQTGELLSFQDVLGSTKRDLTNIGAFNEMGLKWVDNTSDEILAIAEEMMDRLDGVLEYSPEDMDRQDAFKKHFRSNTTGYTFGDLSRVGREFLKKYESLL